MGERMSDKDWRYGKPDARRVLRCEKIMAELATGPLSLRDIAARIHAHPDTVGIYMDEFYAAKQVHIAGWEHSGGNPRRVYGLGNLPDVPFVKLVKVKKRITPQETARRHQLRILACLTRPMTLIELGEALGASYHFARKHIQPLHKGREVYIHARLPLGEKGALVKVYAVGSKKDADYPRRTHGELYRRMKADPDRYDKHLARRRAAKRVVAATSQPNSWAGALGL